MGNFSYEEKRTRRGLKPREKRRERKENEERRQKKTTGETESENRG